MSYKIILICVLIFTSINAQDKYLVFFKDKGVPKNALNKSSAEYKQVEAILSKRAIERRKKTMGENYITYEDLPISKKNTQALEDFGIKIIHRLKWFNAVSCYLTEDQVSRLMIQNYVDKIEKVKVFKSRKDLGSDEFYNNRLEKSNVTNSFDYGPSFTQFNLSEIPAVHDAGISGKDIIIGIIDSGFRWKTHPALQNREVLDEHDFVFNDGNTANEANDAGSQDGHGTFVMSLVGGFDEGNIVGPSYDTKFILAKTENIVGEKNVEEDSYVAALEWMESLGADIITSSLGYSDFDLGEISYTPEQMDGKTAKVTVASEIAFSKGIVMVTSAGNDGNSSWRIVSAPADAENIISVGAVNSSNGLAGFSSRGPTADGRIKPEVTAQGTSNHGAIVSGGYAGNQGTSFSAPIVAGITGMLLSTYPHLTNKQVREIVLASGDKIDDPDNNRGYGLLSAVRAVNYPNLKVNTTETVLSKIFINEDITDPSSVRIHYTINGGNSLFSELNYDGNLKYTFSMQSFKQGDSIEFYYTYNSPGGEKRVPVDRNYNLVHGDLTITSVKDPGIVVLPDNYTLFQNYPNPFNNQTRIEFIALKEEFAELTIYNALGQKVKQLFRGIASKGLNIVGWDGSNDRGKSLASGPYFYSLTIDGKLFSQKMILLK